jgi:hypothetical protein
MVEHVTVSSAYPIESYAVVGSQTVFNFTFTVFEKADVHVKVGNVELAQGDFTFEGSAARSGGFQGGTVTLNTAATDTTVLIWSDILPARDDDFMDGQPLDIAGLNTVLDKVVARQRDQRWQFSRAVKVAPGSTLDPDDILTAIEAVYPNAVLAREAADDAEAAAILAQEAAAEVSVGSVYQVADRAALRALDTSVHKAAVIYGESGRNGIFRWDGSDLSATLAGTSVTSTSVNSTTEVITKTAHGLLTGHAGVVTTAVNGLSLNTIYYAIRVDADTFKLASSFANAVAGTAFNLTGTTNFTFKKLADFLEGIYVIPTGGQLDGSTGAWVRIFSGPVNLMWFGATNDNTGTNTAALQCAFTAAAGRTVLAPAGRYAIGSTVRHNGVVNLIGEGMGAAPGTFLNTAECTQFIASFAAGDIFAITTIYGCTFSGFQMNSSAGQRTLGAGIHISGTSPSNNANTHFDNLAFISQYVGIWQTDCAEHVITRTYHLAWARTAVYNESSAGNEVGPGQIFANYFFGYTTSGTTQTSCLELHSGYFHIFDNLILGAQIGVNVIIDQISSGNPFIHNNWIEEQTITGIRISNTSTHPAAMVKIQNNEFSHIVNGATVQACISIVAGSASWIDGINITGNTMRCSLGASIVGVYINVGTGTNIIIADNDIHDLVGAANCYGILIGAQATTPVLVTDNVMQGVPNNHLYSLFSTDAVVSDQVNGVLFANLPANAKNGSSIFCPDGTFANPVAGSGTGCFAKRINGAWRGD